MIKPIAIGTSPFGFPIKIDMNPIILYAYNNNSHDGSHSYSHILPKISHDSCIL